MTKLEIWTGEKTYLTPIGTIQTPQYIEEKFPAVTVAGITYVVETDDAGQVALSEPMNLSMLKMRYTVESSLSDEQAVAAIEAAINNPPVIEYEPSAEERIAASLEYQNLLSM